MKERLFFALQRAAGSPVEACYRQLIALHRSSPEVIERISAERLGEVLTFAKEHVPYYRTRVRGGEPSLSDFPILTRGELNDNFRELMSDDLHGEYDRGRPRGYSWVEVKTGGSTGVPTTVIHDADFRDRGRAARLFSQYLCGFPLPTPYFRLWGSMDDISHRKSSPSQRLIAWLSNEHLMNAFRMSESDMDSYIREVNASDINYMMAYADAAYQMGRYAVAARKHVRPLTSVMMCAGTVTRDMREAIAQGLQARAHNKYGSRECADMACECTEGGLHIYSTLVRLEVVDDRGALVPAGANGRLLVTLLSNRRFPMIRYEIGDVASLSDARCRCGSPFPLLHSLEGRAVEMLTSTSGAYVTPAFVIHLIGVVHNPGWIRKFQLIQNDSTEFELLMEAPGVEDAELNAAIERIIRDLRAVLGADARIAARRVDDVPLTPTGKHLYTINRSLRRTT